MKYERSSYHVAEDREKEIKRPTVRPVSVFTSFMPHGAPLGEREGATGTWAGRYRPHVATTDLSAASAGTKLII